MKFNKYWLVLVLGLVIMTCSDDDDDTNLVPDRDRTEQQASDRDSLLTYLNSHYYNSSDFEVGVDYSIDDIVITKAEFDGNNIPIIPEGNTLLLLRLWRSRRLILLKFCLSYRHCFWRRTTRFGLNERIRTLLRQRSNTTDVGLSLGHGNHAARVEQVKQVACLDALVIGRMRHDYALACFRIDVILFQDFLALGFCFFELL